MNNKKEIFITALKLLVICSVVATIVASVNFITKDKISYNEKLSTAEALTGIYSDDFNKGFEVSGNDFIISDGNKTVITCSQENFSFSSKLKLSIISETVKPFKNFLFISLPN